MQIEKRLDFCEVYNLSYLRVGRNSIIISMASARVSFFIYTQQWRTIGNQCTDSTIILTPKCAIIVKVPFNLTPATGGNKTKERPCSSVGIRR